MNRHPDIPGAAPFIQGYFAYSENHEYPDWHPKHREKWFRDEWYRGWREAKAKYEAQKALRDGIL